MSLSLQEARELHREFPVLDLHADTPMLAAVTGDDINARHNRKLPKRVNAIGHLDVPRMRQGGLAGQIFGMWTMPYPEILCPRSIHKQLDCIDRTVLESGGGMRCWTGSDIRSAHADGIIATLAGIEGGQALRGDPTTVAEFARRGVRYIGLLHFSADALASGLEDVSLLPHLTQALSERGLSNSTLAKLLGGNAIRVLDDNPPADNPRP